MGGGVSVSRVLYHMYSVGESQPEEIETLFKSFDKDGNGVLDRKEAGKFFEAVWKVVATQGDALKGKSFIMDKWFETFDVNEDGSLQFDEFEEMVNKLVAEHQRLEIERPLNAQGQRTVRYSIRERKAFFGASSFAVVGEHDEKPFYIAGVSKIIGRGYSILNGPEGDLILQISRMPQVLGLPNYSLHWEGAPEMCAKIISRSSFVGSSYVLEPKSDVFGDTPRLIITGSLANFNYTIKDGGTQEVIARVSKSGMFAQTYMLELDAENPVQDVFFIGICVAIDDCEQVRRDRRNRH